MTRLTNQEKSAMRYEALTKVAERAAVETPAFKAFLESKEKPGKVIEPTWRRLETFIKQMVEAGNEVRIIVDTGTGDD